MLWVFNLRGRGYYIKNVKDQSVSEDSQPEIGKIGTYIMSLQYNLYQMWSGVGVCLALQTLVREVKRTLANVGSWIGFTTVCRLCTGLIPGPRNKIKDDWKI